MRVFDPCIDFCGFDTAYIYAVSNAQKIYIRSSSNRDNFIPKSDNFPPKSEGGEGGQTDLLKGLPIPEQVSDVSFCVGNFQQCY